MRDRFLHEVLANLNNHAMLERWDELDLPEGWRC